MAWSLVDRSLVVQCGFYVVVVATAMATVISISMSRNNFGGLCGPYSEASCQAVTTTAATATTTADAAGDNNRNKRSNKVNAKKTAENKNGGKLQTPSIIYTTTSSPIIPTKIAPTSPTSPPPPSPTTITTPTPITTITTISPIIEVLFIKSGLSSVCEFIIGSNTLFNILYAGAMALYHAQCARKSACQIRVGYQMYTKTLLCSSMAAFLITLISACMLTVGLSHFCQSATTAFKSCFDTLNSRCSDTQKQEWFWNGSSIKPTHFHDLIEVTEASNWLNVGFWFVHAAFYTHRLFKQRNISTSYQEPFTNDFLDAFS